MDDTPRGIGNPERPDEPRVTGGGTPERARVASAEPSGEPDLRVHEIRAEIEQTRADMSETIDAIQEKLRPRNIVAEATERVRTATTERVKDMAHTAGETAQDVMGQTRQAAGGLKRSVKENPIPAVMIGVGTAWLLMNRSASASRRDVWRASNQPRTDYDYGPYGQYADYSGYQLDDESGSGWMDRVKNNPIPAALAGVGLAWLAFSNGEDRERMPGMYGRVRGYDYAGDEEGGELYDTAAANLSETAERVSRRGKELTSRTQEYIGETAGEVRRRGRRAKNQLERLMHRNPLLVGAAAAVLGAAVGLALPETERENEWMGEARDNMVERARELAENAASNVKEAAGDVAGEVASRVVTGKDE